MGSVIFYLSCPIRTVLLFHFLVYLAVDIAGFGIQPVSLCIVIFIGSVNVDYLWIQITSLLLCTLFRNSRYPRIGHFLLSNGELVLVILE